MMIMIIGRDGVGVRYCDITTATSLDKRGYISLGFAAGQRIYTWYKRHAGMARTDSKDVVLWAGICSVILEEIVTASRSINCSHDER